MYYCSIDIRIIVVSLVIVYNTDKLLLLHNYSHSLMAKTRMKQVQGLTM